MPKTQHPCGLAQTLLLDLKNIIIETKNNLDFKRGFGILKQEPLQETTSADCPSTTVSASNPKFDLKPDLCSNLDFPYYRDQGFSWKHYYFKGIQNIPLNVGNSKSHIQCWKSQDEWAHILILQNRASVGIDLKPHVFVIQKRTLLYQIKFCIDQTC